MDGRPRRSASNVNYNQLERQYDEQIKAELLASSRRRSSTSDRDVRKRKRESDSPKQIYRHTAIRDGLRNSISHAGLDMYSNGYGQSPDSMNGQLNSTNDYNHEDDQNGVSVPQSSDEDADLKRGPRIVKLQLTKGLKAQAATEKKSEDYQDIDQHPNHVYEERQVRRSSRVVPTFDASEEDDVAHTHHVNGRRAARSVAAYKDESDAESVEQYIPRKSSRRLQRLESDESHDDIVHAPRQKSSRRSLKTQSSGRSLRRARSQSDEDDYVEESNDDEDQISEISLLSDRDDLNDFVEDDEGRSRSNRQKRTKRHATRVKRPRRTTRIADSDEEFSGQSSPVDLQAELEDLRPAREETRRRELRDRTNRPDYALPPPLTDQMIVAASTPTRSRTLNLRPSFRGLYPEYGNLGLGLPTNNNKFGNFGPPTGLQSDSDSSDEEGQTSKTTAKAVAGALLPAMKSLDQSAGGGPSNHGKIKGSNLADADPIGIDKDVSFDSVGGLEDHINQLKEMVSLPLLYPEIFQRFHIAPPRGVLFHGPPGTGKTLMARALAASCSSEGRKISFYMRKGADCLSKWVGEAERQLRLLFDEAKANQPSIIFFDEIDGLAPVRSAKQDQIHASIVSTMLALMDGMDARGQVVVIGATNRPDSVDPALRRPGRFDREFYFPLPSLAARRQIISIQTSRWEPPLTEDFRAQLALQTKGYGGADLRALCTEAALNAVQRRYPQIYASNDKLVIDPSSINVIPRDFMLAIKKIIPSSARSNASGAAVLPDHMRPLLGPTLQDITRVMDKLVPRTTHKTALEDNTTAPDDDNTFEKENMLQLLEQMRTFRPRLLLTGQSGLGQQHLGRAILNHLEGFHVQNIDLAMMYSDSASTAEASLIQAFVEARRHKPSVLYMPEAELWFATASPSVISTFTSLLGTISSNDPLLLLGVTSTDSAELSPEIQDVFGHGQRNNIHLHLSTDVERRNFFCFLTSIITKSPAELPDALPRVVRQLEVLPIAPPLPPREVTKAERKAIEAKDRKTKLMLKAKLGPLMELIKTRYKRFKKPAIDDREIAHLLAVDDETVPDDIGNRDFSKTEDGKILNTATMKTFYNMDINLIEERLWSNLYLTPKQFQSDIEQILHDSSQDESDRERMLKAQEMHTNVLIHLEEMFDTTFIEECKSMAHREVERHKEYLLKVQEAEAREATKAAAAAPTIAAAATDGEVPEDPPSLVADIVQTGTELESTQSTVPTEGSTNVPFVHDVPMTDDLVSLPSGLSSTTQHAPSASVSDVDKALDEEPENNAPASAAESPTEPQQNGQTHKHSPLVSIQSMLVSQPNGSHAPEQPSTQESPATADMAVSAEPQHPPYQLDEEALEIKLRRWVILTDGMTVDQLEQTNSAAVDAIWDLRSDWDRNHVADAADVAIKDVSRLLLSRPSGRL